VKSTRGNFFEDFVEQRGQTLRHPTPRTVTEADATLYVALYGDRRPLHCARTFAEGLGHERPPLPDLLVFHTVFGKTVGQISLNAVANLGYADGRFLAPVYPGDTLHAESTVLGVKEVSSGKAGIVWVRTRGLNQRDEEVLRYGRWVMVEKRDPAKPTGAADAPPMPDAVPAAELVAPRALRVPLISWATGSEHGWQDYVPGERIDHQDGMTIDDADHTLATRLWQNTARVHFDAHTMASSRFGKRLVYGGHVISIAWALAHNGLENCLGVLALNGGAHKQPSFAGDTLTAWTEVVEKAELAGDAGALRVKLNAKNQRDEHVLELDLWIAVARR
jgi:2-methylfumaryl-CoA hydratase